MAKERVIDVKCQCGQLLFTYFKGGRGRLIKCFLDEIGHDFAGVRCAESGPRPACPSCGKALGIVRIVRGRPALKINQGTVQKTRI